MKITPILLAGGIGSRLWPISRKAYPKQFSKFLGDLSLFQKSAKRVTDPSIANFNDLVVFTHQDFRFIVKEQLEEVNIKFGKIILEPARRNTAPTIFAASLMQDSASSDDALLVAPSDHLIDNVEEFSKSLKVGLKAVANENITMFGLKPARPETGFGYLQVGERQDEGYYDLKSFIEKPPKNVAKDILKTDEYLWNSGIFLFKPKVMIGAFQQYAPELIPPVKTAIRKGKTDLDFFRIEKGAWSDCSEISIDYAIMEKAKNLAVVEHKGDWSDMGNWHAVWSQMEKDNNGVASSKHSHTIDCKNSLLRSENDSQEIVGLGLNNIVAVAMPDAVLIADRDHIRDMNKIVPNLIANSVMQAEAFLKEYRPWGWFEILAKGVHFQVKRIHIKKTSAISLQSHKYRSEHWVLVQGIANVTIGEEKKQLRSGESIFIPQGVIHRLENTSNEPTTVIEVQIGSYLGEDDITRYDDFYSREKYED